MTTTKCTEAGREKQPRAAGMCWSLSSRTGGKRQGLGRGNLMGYPRVCTLRGGLSCYGVARGELSTRQNCPKQ